MSSENIYKQTGSIPSSENFPIRYDLYTPSGNSRDYLPVILFLHGFKGFKDWGPFPDACEDLSRAGFAVVAMNFSLNGVGEDPVSFDRLDLFERETLSQDLKDVGSVIEAVINGDISSGRVHLDSDHIGIIGHSRGGHTAVAAAAEYSEIQCLVTWSAVANYREHWSREMVEDWKTKGYTEILNSRTGQIMRVDREVYEDAEENEEKVIALNRVRELHIPSLFIAGNADETVPDRQTRLLYRNCPSELKELRLIPDAGHTFGASHPFEEDEFPEKFGEVLELTENWFLENLA